MAGEGRAVLGVALAPLLPVGSGRARRRLLVNALRALGEEAGRPLDDAAIAPLLPPETGRLAGAGRAVARAARGAAVPQLGGALRLKDSLDHGVEVALRLEMARLALDAGLLPDQAEHVGRLMREALGPGRHSPLGRALLRDGLGQAPTLFQGGALDAAVRGLITLGDGPLVLRRFQDRLPRTR